jgi:hypothetical protein
MQTGRYNISARQGQTFNFSFTIKTDGAAWNLSTYSARMQVRPSNISSTKYLDLVSPTNITLNSTGLVSITVSAAAMSAIVYGNHVYDIELESAGGIVYTVLEGKFQVRQEVTQ